MLVVLLHCCHVLLCPQDTKGCGNLYHWLRATHCGTVIANLGSWCHALRVLHMLAIDCPW